MIFASGVASNKEHNTEEIIDVDHTPSPSAATLVKLFGIHFCIGFVSTKILNQVFPKGTSYTRIDRTAQHNYEYKISLLSAIIGLLPCILFNRYTDHISPEKPIQRTKWEQSAKIAGALSGILLASYMSLLVNTITNTEVSR